MLEFSNPYFLLLIPVCIAIVALLAKKRAFTSKFNKICFVVIRSIVLTLIILGLCKTILKDYTNLTTTIYTVDISASTQGADPLSFLKEATPNKNDLLGVVCFGEKAVIESMPQANNSITSLTSFVKKDFTNITSALKLAQSVIGEKTKKRIVLVSDGQENIDDAVSFAKILKEQGIVVNVLPIKNTIANEVQLSEIKVPKYIKQDTNYDIEIIGNSLTETNAKLLIYRNSELVSNETVTFRKGENRYIFTHTSDKSGGVIYRAEIVPEEDTFPQNNTVYGYSYIEGAPNLLVVDNNGSSSEIIKILSNSKVNITPIKPAELPTEPEQLNIYDGIVLANVPLELMPENSPAALDTFVKNSSGGVMAIGGDNSFGLGEYYKTPLEDLLPVEMELKDKDKLPNLGMIIVIDRSGSMGMGQYGVSKLELAKEAVIRSVDSLKENDSMGVIAFDDGFEWISNFQKVGGNIESIKDDIAHISLGGGTSILPGLTEAYATIMPADTKLKHIILLTDGQAERQGYEFLLDSMNNYGITLSTVAVGSDSDVVLLERLAQMGNGRYYFTNEFTDLPKIFAKETTIASRTYLNNEDFFPKAGDSSPIMASINSIPMLHGYISTTAKDRADILLYSDKDEPILATWQYGLGRSAAFTSDLDGKWSSDWINSNEGISIFKNAVSWLIRSQIATDVSVSTKVSGQGSEILVTFPYAEGIEKVLGKIVSENFEEAEIAFEAIAPGQYKAMLNQNKEGAYILNLAVTNIAGKTENISTGISIPYSEEYNIKNFNKGEGVLKNIASITGGTVLTSPDELFVPLENKTFTENDISNLLLTLALVLFILDIAIRRFPFLTRKLETAFLKLKEIVKVKEPKKAAIYLNKEKPENAQKQSINTNADNSANNKISKEQNVKASEKPATNTSSMLLTGKKKRTGK